MPTAVLSFGEDPFGVELAHVAVVGPVVDFLEAEGASDLGFGLFEGPAAVEHAVGHLGHGRAIDAVVAVEVDGLIGGVGDGGGGLFEEVGEAGVGWACGRRRSGCGSSGRRVPRRGLSRWTTKGWSGVWASATMVLMW